MVKDYMAPVISGLVLAFLAIVFGTVAGWRLASLRTTSRAIFFPK